MAGRTLGAPVSTSNEYEFDYALADAWWLRHATAHHDPDLIAREKICLEKVDAVSGTLRRHRNDIELVDRYGRRTFHAEWVVDARGNMVGELGFCRTPQEGERGDLAGEAAAHGKNLEAAVRPIAFGPAPGFAESCSIGGRTPTSRRRSIPRWNRSSSTYLGSRRVARA